MRDKIFIYSDTLFADWLQTLKGVLETALHEMPMDLTRTLCDTEMIDKIDKNNI